MDKDAETGLPKAMGRNLFVDLPGLLWASQGARHSPTLYHTSSAGIYCHSNLAYMTPGQQSPKVQA